MEIENHAQLKKCIKISRTKTLNISNPRAILMTYVVEFFIKSWERGALRMQTEKGSVN